jgi:hypothetical protein
LAILRLMTNSIFVDWTAPQKRDELPRLHSIPPRRSRGGAERPPVFSTYRIGLLHCIAMRPHQRWQLWVKGGLQRRASRGSPPRRLTPTIPDAVAAAAQWGRHVPFLDSCTEQRRGRWREGSTEWCGHKLGDREDCRYENGIESDHPSGLSHWTAQGSVPVPSPCLRIGGSSIG